MYFYVSTTKVGGNEEETEMGFIEYLQQPSSIYAVMALILNMKTGGLLRVKDLVEYFFNQDVAVDIKVLQRRWVELEKLGFTRQAAKGARMKWKVRLRWRIGYVLTEKGDKAAEALMESINYIKKL